MKSSMHRLFVKLACYSGAIALAGASEPPAASKPPGVFEVPHPTEAPRETVRFQRLFQTPTAVGNGPGMFIYSPVSSFNGNVYYTWFDDDRRPWIVQIRPDGSRATAPVDRPDYRAVDDGHNRLSLGIDGEGYIHIAGDMHNGVNPNRPGPDRFKGAKVMYWRSKKPGEITDFEFLGNHPERCIPMPGPTYAFFARDRNGVLYFGGRMVANPDRKRVPDASRGVGLCRYDAKSGRWTSLGGTLNPVSRVELAQTLFNSVSQTGGWYRWNMAGLAFDQHNRLHFAVNANTSLGEGSHVFYAASDDGGETWHRADGSPVGLPMIDSLEPHPNRPDLVFAPGETHLSTGGPTYPFFDSRGVPGVSVSMKLKTSGGPNPIQYLYWKPDQNRWSDPVDSPVPKSFSWTKNFYLGRDGLINFVDHDRLLRAPGFEKPGQAHKVPGQFTAIDPVSLLEENTLLAVLETGAGRTALYRLDFLAVPEGGWRSGCEDLRGTPLDEKVALLNAGRAAEDGKRFRPEEKITAGEWAGFILEARQWKWKTAPSPDPKADWRPFVPEEIQKREITSPASPISRAVLISMLVRSAPGEAWPEVLERWEKTVPGDGLEPGLHRAVASAAALGLVPAGWLSPAALAQPATRGEAVELLHRLYFPEARQAVPSKSAAELIDPSQTGAAALPGTPPLNVAKWRASDYFFRAGPEKLADGNPQTSFQAAGDQCLELDLGRETGIAGFSLARGGGKNATLRFKAYVAGEDRDWKPAAEGTCLSAPGQAVFFAVTPDRGRYLKLHLLTDKGKVTEITEMAVFQK